MIDLIQNDTKPTLRFTCREGDCGETGTAINLTSCIVKFIFKKALSSGAYKFKRLCDIVDAPNGICEYSWQSNDLDTVGDYVGELEITFPDSKIQTNYNLINFKIRKELG